MNFLKSFLVFSILLMIMVGVMPVIKAEIPQADSATYENLLENAGDKVDLPNYEETGVHDKAFDEDGLRGITGGLYYVLDFMKYILGGLAVIFIVVSAYKLFLAGKSSEEEITKQKTYLVWATVGLLVVFTADTIVKDMFFGAEGEILAGDRDQTLEFAQRTARTLQGIYMLLETFIGSVAVFMIAYEGFRIVTMSYNDEQVTKSKNHVFWSIIALFMIGISEFLVKDVIFNYIPGEGVQIGVKEGQYLLASITNFVSALIGFVSVAMIIYGGYLYVFAGASEENTAKAKKVIIGAVIGIIMAGSAYAITASVLAID
ncbi:MAG: pilin [Patescibacteria group bacterium]|nr:pilin [Patescibacteria group bacterium]